MSWYTAQKHVGAAIADLQQTSAVGRHIARKRDAAVDLLKAMQRVLEEFELDSLNGDTEQQVAKSMKGE